MTDDTLILSFQSSDQRFSTSVDGVVELSRFQDSYQPMILGKEIAPYIEKSFRKLKNKYEREIRKIGLESRCLIHLMVVEMLEIRDL